MGTGIEQRSLGGMCARAGGGGVEGCTRDNPHCLLSALVLGLVNGKQPFRIDVFQTRPLNAVRLIRSMCLHVCRELVPQGTAGMHCRVEQSPGTLPLFLPSCGGSRAEP